MNNPEALTLWRDVYVKSLERAPHFEKQRESYARNKADEAVADYLSLAYRLHQQRQWSTDAGMPAMNFLELLKVG